MTIDDIKQILREVMEQTDLEIHMKDKLIDDLGMCSFDFMMMIYLIEERFGLKVDTEKLSVEVTIEGILHSIYR